MMQQILKMALIYIEAVDDENFLTHVMTEKDFNSRDALNCCGAGTTLNNLGPKSRSNNQKNLLQ